MRVLLSLSSNGKRENREKQRNLPPVPKQVDPQAQRVLYVRQFEVTIPPSSRLENRKLTIELR